MKELEKKNKEYVDRYTVLVNECYRMRSGVDSTLGRDKNQQLSCLVNCLTSMLAIQSSGYRELPAPETVEPAPPMPFKKESMMMIRKMLVDSLKALSMYSTKLDPAMLRAKQLMNSSAGLATPMIEDAPANQLRAVPPSPKASAAQIPAVSSPVPPRPEEEIKEPPPMMKAIPAPWPFPSPSIGDARKRSDDFDAYQSAADYSAGKIYGDPMMEAPACPSPNPLLASPLPQSRNLSPLRPLSVQDPFEGNSEIVPSYYNQIEAGQPRSVSDLRDSFVKASSTISDSLYLPASAQTEQQQQQQQNAAYQKEKEEQERLGGGQILQ